MLLSRTDRTQLTVLGFIYLLMLSVKYYLDAWDSNYKDVISSYLWIVHLFSWIWISYSLYISTNKERVFFVFNVFFVLFGIIIKNNLFYYWLITAYPLFIIFSRLSYVTILNIVFSSQTIMFFCIVMLMPIADNLFFYDDRYIRFTGGLGNPNTLASFLFSYYLSIILMLHIKLKERGGGAILSIIFISVFFILGIYYTYSRTHISLLTLVFFLFLLPSSLINKIINKGVVMVLITFGFILQAYLSIGFSNGDELSEIANTYSSGRVMLSSKLLVDTGWPNIMFGADIADFKPVDFFYVSLIYSSGVFYTVLFLLAIFWALLKSNDTVYPKVFLIAFMAMVLTSYTEAYYNIPIINFTILFLYKFKGGLLEKATC